jgi:hypothetical protein
VIKLINNTLFSFFTRATCFLRLKREEIEGEKTSSKLVTSNAALKYGVRLLGGTAHDDT